MPPRPMLRIDVDRKAMGRVKRCSDMLNPKDSDLRSLMLPVLGQVHRKQQAAIFATEGAKGATGRWRALSPGYAKRKRRVAPRAKILVLTTEMRSRFLKPGGRHYVQRLERRSPTLIMLLFGAVSAKAHRHFKGAPSRNLPRRDPVSKSRDQLAELRRRFVSWWRLEWLPRFARVCGDELRRGARL